MKTLLTESEVYIVDDVTLADIVSLSDCERAEVTLTSQINEIEQQLANPHVPDDVDWEARATSAVRLKRSIRHVVRERAVLLRKKAQQAMNNDLDRRLIAMFKDMWPAQFAAADAALKETVK